MSCSLVLHQRMPSLWTTIAIDAAADHGTGTRSSIDTTTTTVSAVWTAGRRGAGKEVEGLSVDRREKLIRMKVFENGLGNR